MEINWIQLGKEIANTPGGAATLRILQAHGLTHLVTMDSKGISRSNSIANTLDEYVAKAHRN